ncbi:MAG: dATP/dGTP diphosphohydrolase domain-containing protein [Rhodothermales bacterium]
MGAKGRPGFVLKDSGSREEFDTGSRRDTRSGKGRYDLMSPFILARDARLLELGALKYGERNWERGQPVSRFVDSALRHLMRYMEGHRDEDHLAAARWNIGAIMHMEEMVSRGILPPALMDLPDWDKKAR